TAHIQLQHAISKHLDSYLKYRNCFGRKKSRYYFQTKHQQRNRLMNIITLLGGWKDSKINEKAA
ncbi:hypothetical protein, partial [Vibrio cholerae]|uniref:hypothetical protein n=1 Tax=Vibrio cholerae TaxID=666 RepID=UPI001E552F9C